MSKENSRITYSSYLALDELLSAQRPISSNWENPAHDEMLFIVVHQVYELWFKLIVNELDSVLAMLRLDHIDEKNIGVAVSRVERIIEIQKILIDQIRVLETMTPLDFLDFRAEFGTASGFQSVQFRIFENKLGLSREGRFLYGNRPYDSDFNEKQREAVKQSESELSLFSGVQNWLERTPFIKLDSFNFIDQYKAAVDRILDRDRQKVNNNSSLSPEAKDLALKGIASSEDHFQAIFSREKHSKLREAGHLRFSYEATISALFINLYRDQPILHLPYKFLHSLISLDENLTLWRYNHAVMVMRMLGSKIGSGGSSGYDYLKMTVEKHKIFGDLFNLSTLYIPRSELPSLPKDFEKNLGFYFSFRSEN
ncbi:MAG: tryptophan 2,3-dioxygenase [Bdellovibrionales bacterium]|nr:tryptophan 2,3-dioxygenase [Bdellovibrionales bacterium]